MFGFQFSPIPIGGFEIVNIRFLLTGNMVPNLPAPDGHEQNMRLFRWYRNTGNAAITLPTNRKASGWIRQDESFAVGAGLGLGLATGKVVVFDVFVFYHKSPTENGLMIAIEVYILKGQDPVGFGVLEFDLKRDKWGFIVGVAFTLKNITGFSVPLLGDFVSLTGTLYTGNKPGTFAIGQLNDQTTWLSFKSEISTFVKLGMLVGLCVQVVDAPGGPRGFGFVFSAKGGARFGIGKFQIYAGFGFVAGVWGNESTESGFVAWIEAGVRIKVFWIFNFGASIKIEFDYLGGEPPYRRLGCEIRINTPWFMPDVTFRFEKVWNQPAISSVRTLSTPLISSGALDTGERTQVDVAVTPMTGTSIDEKALYNMSQLRAFGPPTLPAGALDALVPTTVDSVIAINFKPSVDDKLSVGEITPAGAGTQEVNDLEATYELVEAGIRRRPRFGAGSSVWTNLLAPEDTVLMNPADFPPGFDVEAHFSSTVSFRWDRDLLKENRLDPRRLLINAETPFTFVTSNPEGDESHGHSDAGWPCCDKKRLPVPAWHQLDFMSTSSGMRAPRQQAFTDSNSRLHWLMPVPPLVVPASIPPSPGNVARVRLAPRRQRTFAAIQFDEPVFLFQLFVQWRTESHGSLIVEAYDGLELEDQQVFPLSGASPSMPIAIERPHGITRIRLVFSGEEHGEQSARDVIEISRMRYRTVDEMVDLFTQEEKCKSKQDSTLSGSGKLAWLPNHDYEISLKTTVILDHAKSEAQNAEVDQKVYFRTKGLPGLNRVERIGDELEQYVESTYPGASPRRLYRSEAVNIAFNERFNSLLPVDRAPSPDNPDERNQILEWVLAVERVGSATTSDRITKTAPDWVVAHRTMPPPLVVIMDGVVDSAMVLPLVRGATTHDPLMVRFEALVVGLPSCSSTPPALHNSQVLVHQPADSLADPGDPELWQPKSTFRANVRRKDAPFIERAEFHDADSTAFDFSNEGSATPIAWTSAGGAMRLVSSASVSPPQHAVFGESTWNHVQITTSVDPEGGAAGIGVAVAGTPSVSQALMVLVDESSNTLEIVRRLAGVSMTLASVALPTGATAPYPLQVFAFDDKLRARVGEATVEADRDELREGRLSLVAVRGGRFGSLTVEGVDAYRFEFQSSRFTNFEAHIGSFDGEAAEIAADSMGAGAATATVSLLLSATAPQVIEVMKPNSDPEERQRLFDRWVRDLAIPLRPEVTRVELSRSSNASGAAQLFLLESPEPLPFTLDVSVELKKRFVVPAGCLLAPLSGLLARVSDAIRFIGRSDRRARARTVPQALRDLVDELHFEDDRVAGVVRRGVLDDMVTTPRKLVRAVEVEGRRRLEVYELGLRPGRGDRLLLAGTRVKAIDDSEGADRSVRAFETMRVGEVGFADELGRVVGPFAPVTETIFIDVDLLILSNGSETQALLIPVNSSAASSAQGSGRYQLNFTLDRARFRSEADDSTTNYRAEVLLPFGW